MAYVTKINGYDIKDSEARLDLEDEVAARQSADTALDGRIDDETLARQSADTALDGKIGDLTSLDTTDKTDLVSAINEVNAKTPMINITWSVLKSLRDDGNLVKGMQYRITDFVTTTTQADTQSAGHAFDVIVTADSESVLNENARAAAHVSDTYFSDSKLQAWKLKYCLDNDTNRFVWADSANGKGVIYQMVDEFENDLPYDFKNIQFKRYKANGHIYRSSTSDVKYNAISAQMKTFLNNGTVNILSLPYYYQNLDSSSIDGTWYDENGDSVDGSTLGTVNNFLYEQPSIVLGVTSDYKYFYTFSYMSGVDAEPADATISYNTVYKNKFGWIRNSSGALKIGANVFIGNSFKSNTVGNDFNSNTVGNDFKSNTVGNSFKSNTVGNDFNYNTVGNSFYYNTVGNSFNYNTVGNDFNSNTVGNSFNYNTVGNDFNSNTVGNSFNYNTVGNSFNSNTVGNSFYYNTVGNYYYYNTVGNSFKSNTVGNDFNYNTVGNSFYYNTVGNDFNSNTVGNYYYYNTVEDGCKKLNFTVNGTSSRYVQKYRVLAGTAPSSAQTVSVTAGNTIPYNVKQTGANSISVEAA